MSTTALKEALKNCLINFDRRVQLTDLLQQFKLSYADVNRTIEEHLSQQEAEGVKYEKRFLVQGLDTETKTQIYTVVNGEKKMRDWLKRLQKAECALYSVEVAGGTKSPAVAFKPTEYHTIKLANLEVRPALTKPTGALANGSAAVSGAATNIKVEPKQEMKKLSAMEAFTKKATTSETNKSSTNKFSPKKENPTPEKKKTSPEDKKPKAAATSKKGIGNFFAPASAVAATGSKTVHNKGDKKSATGTSSPKKMKDFFKKQAEKPKAAAATTTKLNETEKKTENKKTPDPNESVQLFTADTDSEVDASSDEEEKLEALRRDIITADAEVEKPVADTSGITKRRRVISSDEEEEPQQKIEKREETAATEECETVDITSSAETTSQPQSETFLDDDGFLITIKPKKKGSTAASSVKSNKSPVKKSPPTRKSPVKAAATKTKSTAPAKTKQGNIMNFFSKK